MVGVVRKICIDVIVFLVRKVRKLECMGDVRSGSLVSG